MDCRSRKIGVQFPTQEFAKVPLFYIAGHSTTIRDTAEFASSATVAALRFLSVTGINHSDFSLFIL